jgi:hypothetical protein
VIQSPGGFSRQARIVVVLLLLVLQGISAVAQGDALRRTYVWDYGGKTWSFTYDFPQSSYQLQKSLTRTLDYTAYAVYVSDLREAAMLEDFVTQFEASLPGQAIWDRLNLVIALVQSIPYMEESCEYPRYPIEMLVDQQGDCEDSAILTAALVRHMGFGVVLLAFLEEHHMAVGIRVLPPAHQSLQSYSWNGELYYYLEPTSPGWAIGQIPPAYQSIPAIIGL